MFETVLNAKLIQMSTYN